MENCQFNQVIDVSIETNTHDQTLYIAKRITHICKSWSHSVRFEEHKSARKGDVLKRDFLIYQTAYPSEIIIFREALNIICRRYDISFDANVSSSIRFCTPKDSSFDLIK